MYAYKGFFDIRSVFNSRQSTDKQVDVRGDSTVSFTRSFPQNLLYLQWSGLPIHVQPFFRSNAVWCVSYQSSSHSWNTDIPIDTNCAPLLADLFLYSYQHNLFRNCYQIITKKTSSVLQPLDISMMSYPSTIIIFTIYPNEPEIKDTTESKKSVHI
jgi:hypothetical protein